MHGYRWIVPGVVLGFLIAALAHAEVVPPPSPDEQLIQAVISAPRDIAVGKTFVLDASASHTTGERPEYRWSIDETKQVIGKNVEAIFTPEKAGKLTFRLTIKSIGMDGEQIQSEAAQEIIAYKRKIVLLADASVPRDKLYVHSVEALREGVFIKIVQPDPSTQPLATEDALVTLLGEQKDILNGADAVVMWTEGIAGLQALLRSVQGNPEREALARNITIVLITDQSLSTIGRTTQGVLTLLSPKKLIVTRKEAINPLATAENIDAFESAITSRDIDALTLTASSFSMRPWNLLSTLVNYLLAHGVSGQTVILLLMLPVIATIFAFLKQVIGITTFGLYTPSIVALSFLALGVWTGIIFLLLILIIGYLTRSAMRRWNLLYIPKVAIILAVVSLTLLILVGLGTAWGLAFSRDTVFILLIMSTLAENFLQLKTEEGWLSAVFGISETVLGALLCVFIVRWQTFQSLVLAYPELVLLSIVINLMLGRWTGLRLVEYFRFREVFLHLQEEE